MTPRFKKHCFEFECGEHPKHEKSMFPRDTKSAASLVSRKLGEKNRTFNANAPSARCQTHMQAP